MTLIYNHYNLSSQYTIPTSTHLLNSWSSASQLCLININSIADFDVYDGDRAYQLNLLYTAVVKPIFSCSFTGLKPLICGEHEKQGFCPKMEPRLIYDHESNKRKEGGAVCG